jgi:hypothetical protein
VKKRCTEGLAIPCRRINWSAHIVNELVQFGDTSMPLLITAPFVLMSISDPVGLAAIDYDPSAARSHNFHHDAKRYAGHGQPKRQNREHFHGGQRAD